MRSKPTLVAVVLACLALTAVLAFDVDRTDPQTVPELVATDDLRVERTATPPRPPVLRGRARRPHRTRDRVAEAQADSRHEREAETHREPGGPRTVGELVAYVRRLGTEDRSERRALRTALRELAAHGTPVSDRALVDLFASGAQVRGLEGLWAHVLAGVRDPELPDVVLRRLRRDARRRPGAEAASRDLWRLVLAHPDVDAEQATHRALGSWRLPAGSPVRKAVLQELPTVSSPEMRVIVELALRHPNTLEAAGRALLRTEEPSAIRAVLDRVCLPTTQPGAISAVRHLADELGPLLDDAGFARIEDGIARGHVLSAVAFVATLRRVPEERVRASTGTIVAAVRATCRAAEERGGAAARAACEEVARAVVPLASELPVAEVEGLVARMARACPGSRRLTRAAERLAELRLR